MSQQLAPEHPDRKVLELQVGELQKRLRSLVGDLSTEIGDSVVEDSGLGPPLQRLPDLMHEYAALTLEMQVREQILAFLDAKLEEAKYGEARNTPTLQVLDLATPPHTRSFPRRGILTVAGAGTALVLLTLLAFVLEAWQKGSAAQQDRLAAIRGEWRQ